MVKITTWVNKTKKNNFLMLMVNYYGNRFSVSTGIEIPNLNQYDNSKVRFNNKQPNFKLLNESLQSLISDLTTFSLSLDRAKDVKYNCNLIKEHFKSIMGKQTKVDKKLCFYLNEFTQLRKSGKEKNKSGLNYADKTIENYNTLLHHLEHYENRISKKLDFSDITSDFYLKIQNHLNSNNYSINHVGGIFKLLKSFMNWSFEKGLHTNLDFKKSTFRAYKMESDQISLSIDEVMIIYNLELEPNQKHLERIIDFFVFQCFTGLRYSDIKNLKPENVNLSNKTISVTTLKTDKKVIIPLHPVALEILKKYELFLPKIPNSKVNTHIKQAAKLANLDESILVNRYVGGRKIEKIQPKYELITTHTARRSFITNSLRMGIPAEIIMKISSHSDLKTFQKYVKLTENDVIDTYKKYFGT